MSNKRLVLIAGETGSGKTASLRDLQDQEGVAYINCESGKEVPFRNKFQEVILTDPEDLFDILQDAENDANIHTIVIDSLTYLMDMYESLYIVGAVDGRAAWGNYNQYFKELMQQHVAKSTKRIIFLAHVTSDLNTQTGTYEVKVPIKGALKNNGIESYFSIVVAVKKMRLKDLEDYENDYLEITARDEKVGYKHVFQTLTTKATVGDRIRGPFDLFQDNETFIDNNAETLLNIIDEYYN